MNNAKTKQIARSNTRNTQRTKTKRAPRSDTRRKSRLSTAVSASPTDRDAKHATTASQFDPVLPASIAEMQAHLGSCYSMAKKRNAVLEVGENQIKFLPEGPRNAVGMSGLHGNTAVFIIGRSTIAANISTYPTDRELAWKDAGCPVQEFFSPSEGDLHFEERLEALVNAYCSEVMEFWPDSATVYAVFARHNGEIVLPHRREMLKRRVEQMGLNFLCAYYDYIPFWSRPPWVGTIIAMSDMQSSFLFIEDECAVAYDKVRQQSQRSAQYTGSTRFVERRSANLSVTEEVALKRARARCWAVLTGLSILTGAPFHSSVASMTNAVSDQDLGDILVLRREREILISLQNYLEQYRGVMIAATRTIHEMTRLAGMDAEHVRIMVNYTLCKNQFMSADAVQVH